MSGSEGHDWFDYLIGSATVLAAVIGIFAVLYARRAVIAAGLTITQMRQTRYQEDLRGVTAAVDHFRQTYRGSRPKVPGRPLSTDPAIKAAVGKLRVAVGGVPLPQSIKDQFDALATPGRDLGADLDALLRAIQEEQERAFYVGRGR